MILWMFSQNWCNVAVIWPATFGGPINIPLPFHNSESDGKVEGEIFGIFRVMEYPLCMSTLRA
jgi:hypothetical protein